jgi:hypothetical protein
MLRLIPVTVLSLLTTLVYAVEEEPPVETSMTAVIVFFAISILCVGLYVWYTMKNEKNKEKKEGDKF